MKWFILACSLVLLFFLAGCQQPFACTADAKVCDDGTVLSREGPDCAFPECPSSSQVQCTPDQRATDACPEIYEPVCGWNDPQRIQCITYPCAQTYSNSCFACQDANVLYWTKGECPSPR